MQKNKNFIFAVFVLILASGLMHFYSTLKFHFSPLKDYEKQLAQAHEAHQRDQLRIVLVENQMLDLREQVVALGISEKSFPRRQIASIAPVSGEPIVLSSALMAKGKAAFKKGRYQEAIKVFREAIEKYPVSISMEEAHFFLAESYYLNNQPQEALDIIYEMMNHFPESELTGYIMLRMGLIMQARNRPDEASEVYRTLLEKFSNEPRLVSQAQSLLKDVAKQ